MKNLKFVFACLFLIMLGLGSFAENATDYFVGKWKVQVSGTPQGDAKMVLHLERVDGKLTGDIKNDQGDPTKIERVEEKETSITVFYSTMGYDINLSLEKVDDKNVKGSLMGMFDAKGERMTE